MLGMSTTATARDLAHTTGLRRRVLTMQAPMAVACPRCHAPAGYECRTTTGNRPISFHGSRRTAAAHLTDDTARLQLLAQVYEHLAAQTTSGSIWEARAQTIRDILNEEDS